MNRVTIDQSRIVNARLADQMDFNDWAILVYIEYLEQDGHSVSRNGFFHLKYKKLLVDMPLLPFKTKSALSKRLRKLCRLALIRSFLSEDGGLFVKTTDYYHSVVNLS